VGLANELLDALPVHRVGRRDGRLVEYHVTWQDGWFAEVPAEPSTPALAAHLVADGVDLAEGQRAEVCLAATAWLVAAAALERGWLLLIDYGHPAAELYGPRRFAGTLRTYRGHEVDDDPYRAVGRQDITAHVDITALRRAAAEAGLVEAGETSQARFLTALGLGDMLTSLGRDEATDVAAYVEARAAVARLLDPRHLGAFRVMAWSRGVGAGLTLPGFEPPGRGA
jgi:SAM-dependent MidA family methyltransferase